MAKGNIHRHLHEAGIADGLATGRPPAGVTDRRPEATIRVEANHATARPLPRRGRVKRYIITAAQNNTPVHPQLWANLQAYAAHVGAEILVSTFFYRATPEPVAFAPEVLPHICNDRVRLAPTLVFCGELKIRPTAVSPLSGLLTYTGSDSGIVPHAKLAMEPCPVAKGTDPKHMYTTGACTLRHYAPVKEGQKAEFHHAYAALIVEVDSDGDWFVRQLNATDTGSFQDFTTKVYADVDGSGSVGVVEEGVAVAGIWWGDIHEEQLEAYVARVCWGPEGIIDALHPAHQFVHDLLDFRRRNHHDWGNPHAAFEKWARGTECVRTEVRNAARFLEYARRDWCETAVVASNHDEALLKWLRTADYKTDPVNAVFFLEAQLATYRALESDDEDFNVVEWAMRGEGCPDATVFLRRDQEYIVAGIDLGSHGDLGPNGTKASPQSLKRSGKKRGVGHGHGAGIWDGLYMAGVTGALNQRYNRGDSSWSRTHGLVYPNGKRALFTMRGEKWRAETNGERKANRS